MGACPCASNVIPREAAWAALETEAGRQAYLAELKSGGSAQVDIGRIYQAEQAFEKVASLAAGRAYAEALARVNEALALYADEPEYHVWKAWLEFLLAPEPQRKVQRAASERAIESALQRSPKCVPGWLFLGRMAKLLPQDWERMYGHPVHFLETFTDPVRYKGTCYRAANWVVLGQTTGRGNNAPTWGQHVPIKLILAYPLTPRFREVLAGMPV